MPDNHNGDKEQGHTHDHLLEENRRLAQRYLELESTTRKQLEKLRSANAMLSRGESHMRLLLENAVIGFALLDLSNRIVSVNQTFAGMLGHTPDEMAGENVGNYVYVGKLPAFSRLTGATGTRSGPNETIEMVAKNGSLVPCRLSVSEWLDDGGGLRGRILLAFDAGDELRAVRRLHELEAFMAEAEKSRALFVEVVSRELRSPAAGIMGMARMLMDRGLDEHQRELVGVIHSSASYLTRLVDDIIDVAQPDAAGKLRPEPVAFSPANLIQGVADMYAVRALEKGLNLRIQVADNVPDRVMGDEPRLRRILAHLMENAVKFTDEGHVALTADLMGEYLRFMVSDTGPGLDAETERALLADDPIEDSAAARRHGGIGVGLNLCRRLLTVIGAKLAFETELGRGSEFHFAIPLAAAAGTDRGVEPPPEAMRLPQLSILLADANPLTRSAIQAFLHFDGHTLTLAESGIDVAEKCRTAKFDVAILDLHLSKLDGLQTVRLIRDDEKTSGRSRLPVILMGMGRDEERYFRAGVDGILRKPVQAVELMAAIARAADVRPLSVSRNTEMRLYSAEAKGSSIRRLDGSQLVNLRQVMLDDQFTAILRFFMEDAVPDLITLHDMASAENPDGERIVFAANKTRGLASYLGFAALADLLKRIEKAARSGAADRLRELAAELTPTTDDSLEELKRIFPEAFATMSELKSQMPDGE